MPRPPAPRPYAPPDTDVAAPYADDWLVIAEKPPGLLSAPGRGADKQDCVTSRLAARYGLTHIVHRLDMDTSGLLLLARDMETGRALSAAFRERRVAKTYEAMVYGHPAGESGEIDLPVGRDWTERPLRRIDWKTGKPALTRWSVKRRIRTLSWLELVPVTGRTHQLRLHMASAGHPIAGDQLYGVPDVYQRLHLHATSLHFQHPVTGREISFTSPAPFAPGTAY